ncbi:type II toxin-antitoxin system HicA family toxin [Dyadobacter sp. CY261]|uniref:type II toxin-antitoxin system HicA family toxin n=1 Tax=Dyadobacter sp. CY261 TaxID=2907203 RepID=UPI0038D372CC
MNAKELIKIPEQNGWKEARCRGSHRIFKHPQMPQAIPVPYHGRKEGYSFRDIEQNLKTGRT